MSRIKRCSILVASNGRDSTFLCRLLCRVVALLAETLEIVRGEEQHRVSLVRNDMIDNCCLGYVIRETELAQRLPKQLPCPELPPCRCAVEMLPIHPLGAPLRYVCLSSSSYPASETTEAAKADIALDCSWIAQINSASRFSIRSPLSSHVHFPFISIMTGIRT